MAHLRSICTAIILGSAMSSRAALAQAASVSLTHTVSVTVPARLKVAVENGAALAKQQGSNGSSGLNLRIDATRPWSLSIRAPRRAQLRVSRDAILAAVDENQTNIRSGPRAAAASTVIFLDSDAQSDGPIEQDSASASTVVLTIVAQ
ncbi:MAG TPA: hypothetical protein VIH53_00425 [Gemmatimonadaceae bacterium]